MAVDMGALSSLNFDLKAKCSRSAVNTFCKYASASVAYCLGDDDKSRLGELISSTLSMFGSVSRSFPRTSLDSAGKQTASNRAKSSLLTFLVVVFIIFLLGPQGMGLLVA